MLRAINLAAKRSDEQIDIVYFLACEVGGSKYLFGSDQHSIQIQVLRHNMQMYEVVWPWVYERNLRTIFVSSQLANEHIPYGTVKRVGESWAEEHPLARTVQLWNIYGIERDGIKSHVVNDWVSACLKQGRVEPRTNGFESRQFLHSVEAADAFIQMAEDWPKVPQYVHLTTGKWTTLRDLASEINVAFRHLGLPACEFEWPDIAARGNVQRRSPNMTSPFHLETQLVASRAAALLGKSLEQISTQDIAQLANSGQHHLLGNLGLQAGLQLTIQQIQAQKGEKLSTSREEL